VTFLHPILAAAAIGAISIPILTHILMRRRRPVMWAAMRFLLEACPLIPIPAIDEAERRALNARLHDLRGQGTSMRGGSTREGATK
jgi:hypothetical protein